MQVLELKTVQRNYIYFKRNGNYCLVYKADTAVMIINHGNTDFINGLIVPELATIKDVTETIMRGLLSQDQVTKTMYFDIIHDLPGKTVPITIIKQYEEANPLTFNHIIL